MIRTIADKHRDQQASDRDLLLRFVEKRDQDAFTALVRRHGSMFIGVGLRALRHYQDAEDVCQATFLLLAKKGKTVAWRDSVANWLHRAAYHMSLTARRTAKRRDAQQSKIQPRLPPDPLAELTARDLQSILDEELDRLAQNYRAPLVLCCLEGKTREEAARFLGVPVSTVISRLVRGRELLRRRLADRGVPLSLAFAGMTLFSETVRAAMPATLVRTMSQLALHAAAGKAITDLVSANVVALFRGGMRTMLLTKLKTTTAGVLLAGLLVYGFVIAGLGTLPDSSVAQQPEGQKKAAKKDTAPPKPPVQRVLKTEGLVHSIALSPDGKTAAAVIWKSGDPKTGAVVLWNIQSGKVEQTLDESIDRLVFRCVVFSKDGKRLRPQGLACGTRESRAKSRCGMPAPVN
jgi:RNA polymerase sigma factor (sigma-70 family)